MESARKLHAVCLPGLYQSHISAMLKVAKILHSKGFHITFVPTEFNYRRWLRSLGPGALDGLPDFQFRTIPDGLPITDLDSNRDMVEVSEPARHYTSGPFFDLVSALNKESVPAVTCIICDGFNSFTCDPTAEKLGIPIVHLWTISACSIMGFRHHPELEEKGLIAPLKDSSYSLDTVIDWLPGMKRVRVKDIPNFFPFETTGYMNNYVAEVTRRSDKASAVIINTFEALESDVLNALTCMYPHHQVYAIGPLHTLLDKVVPKDDPLYSLTCNLWREDEKCLRWLDSREPNSVIYVNFGSIAFLTGEQLVEFAMGIANSKHSFLWIIRPDLVNGEKAVLPQEFYEETKGRGMLTDWCPQEAVLNHPSIGGFLTHCGWNSILESVTAGIPIICWPSFADQPTNRAYSCREWGIGLEVDADVNRKEVAKLVRELMEGEEGKEMKRRAAEWKKLADEATDPNGSSSANLEKLIDEILK